MSLPVNNGPRLFERYRCAAENENNTSHDYFMSYKAASLRRNKLVWPNLMAGKSSFLEERTRMLGLCH